MDKKKKTFIAIMSVFLVLAAIPYSIARHIGIISPIFKVTDPSSPFFNPDNFRFNDYGSFEDEAEAFRKLFPVGTKKEFIDRVLLTAGKGKVIQSAYDASEWLYVPPTVMGGFSKPNYIFIYDNNDRLINIKFTTLEKYLYSEQDS